MLFLQLLKWIVSLSNYSKTVPLVPEYTGNVANGYAIDQMTFSKDKVKIYGDESKIKGY